MENQVDRFGLEEQIMRCWTIIDQVNSVIEGTLDHDWTNDQIANALLGIKQVYDLEFNKLFDAFESLIQQKKL